MPHALLEVAATDRAPAQFLQANATLFAVFDRQDSGNISYGVQLGAQRYFAKTAGAPDDTRPLLGHAARVGLLRNAVRLHHSVQHAALLPILHVIETATGPILFYPWFEGELLGARRDQRCDPRSAFQRFRALPAAEVLRCLDRIFDLHEQLARAGWIAHDFYDGCLLYNFAAEQLAVMDLDTYNQGAFQNTMGRMFGSTRFMAPEEFELGAPIDERTTVFTMGRTAFVLLSGGASDAGAFRGGPAVHEVAMRACEPDRAQRFGSLAEFTRAWRAARGA